MAKLHPKVVAEIEKRGNELIKKVVPGVGGDVPIMGTVNDVKDAINSQKKSRELRKMGDPAGADREHVNSVMSQAKGAAGVVAAIVPGGKIFGEGLAAIEKGREILQNNAPEVAKVVDGAASRIAAAVETGLTGVNGRQAQVPRLSLWAKSKREGNFTGGNSSPRQIAA